MVNNRLIYFFGDNDILITYQSGFWKNDQLLILLLDWTLLFEKHLLCVNIWFQVDCLYSYQASRNIENVQ